MEFRLQAPLAPEGSLHGWQFRRRTSVSHQEARGPGQGTIRSIFPCFPQQIRYSSDSTSKLSIVKPKFGSEFQNVIVSDPVKCRIYVLHNHRSQIRNGQGACSGPMAWVLRPQRAAILARLRGRNFGMQSNAQLHGPGPQKIECAAAHFHWAPLGIAGHHWGSLGTAVITAAAW